MDCQECRVVTSAELDGEAAPDEAAAAHDHLEGCWTCRSAVERAIWVTRVARIRLAEHCPDLARVHVAALAAWAGMVARTQAPDPLAEQPSVPTAPGSMPEVLEAAKSGPGTLIALSDARAGAISCGCLATCGCGCQTSGPCQCSSRAA
jgi:hypothetical protein